MQFVHMLTIKACGGWTIMGIGRFQLGEFFRTSAQTGRNTAYERYTQQAIRPAREISRQLELILLATILVSGALLRLLTEAKTSLWIDEGFTLAISQLPFWQMWTVPFDSHPPLHFTLVKIADVFADGEHAVRLPSVIAGTATIALLHSFSRRLIGPVGALVASASLALSFTHLVHSDNGRNYALLLFFLTGAMYALFVLRERLTQNEPWLTRRSGGAVAAYMLCSLAALYTHNVAILFLFVLNAAFCARHLLVNPRGTFDFVVNLAAINAPALILWAPWALQMASTADVFDWLVQPDAREAIRTLLVAIGPNNAPVPFILAVLATIALGGVMSLFLRPRLVLAIAIPLLIFPAFIYLLGFLAKPIYMERTLLPAVIGASLAIGTVAAHLRSALVSYTLVGLALAGTGLSTASFLSRTADTTNLGGQVLQDWRGAIAAHDAAGTALLICDTFSWPTVAHYASESPVYIFASGGEVWHLDHQDWLDLYGLPASERTSSRAGDISPTIMDWRRRVARDWAGSAGSHDRIAFVKPDLFCNDDEPARIRATLADSGYHLDARSTHAGLDVELYSR